MIKGKVIKIIYNIFTFIGLIFVLDSIMNENIVLAISVICLIVLRFYFIYIKQKD